MARINGVSEIWLRPAVLSSSELRPEVCRRYQRFTAALPADLPAAIFVVLHMRDDSASNLATILDQAGPLPAGVARDAEQIGAGRIYVAPPGHHLLVDGDIVGVKAGPKENRFRPSIDALFRSAAYTCRERVIGVVLSGTLSDGTSGLWTIKRFGGITVVQDPQEAAFDAMPLSALEQVEVDYLLPVAEIGPVVGHLCATEPAAVTVQPSPELVERIRTEVDVAASDDSFNKGMMDFGELSPFTCPECHGTLVRIKEGPLLRYRCHTGHGFSANALLSGVTESVNSALWNALRAMEESVMLLEHMAKHFAENDRHADAAVFLEKARQARMKARILQEQAISSEHLSEDNLVTRKASGQSAA
jgi:two-component system chemotaxis response regulator CheB